MMPYSKPHENIAPKQIFTGVVHEPTLILNSRIVLGILYCVQLFFEGNMFLFKMMVSLLLL